MGETEYTAGAIDLGTLDLVIGAALVLIAGGVSVLLKLGLEKRLAIAAVRVIVQLLAVGYVLKWVFELSNIWLILAMVLLMCIAAARAGSRRPQRALPGAFYQMFGTLVISGVITTLIVVAVIIRVDPWWKPQYLIPLLGMVLGNSMNGVSLAMDGLLERLAERRDEIEMQLGLGATRWEAAQEALGAAVKRAMIPVINSMTVVGIVLLPGMMSGQILAGADPFEAVKYQIVVMFMIGATTSLSCIIFVMWTYFRLFTQHHQLDVSMIIKRKNA